MTDPKPEPLPHCGLPTWGRPCTRVRECSHTACPLRRPLTAGPGDGGWPRLSDEYLPPDERS